MNLRTKLLTLGLVAATASLSAQDSRWDVGGALNVTAGTATKSELTNQPVAFGLEAGFTGKLYGTTVDFRAGLAMHVFKGKEMTVDAPYFQNPFKTDSLAIAPQNVTNSMSNTQLTFDIFTNTGVEGLRIVTGLSLNHWKRDRKAVLVNAVPQYVTPSTTKTLAAGTVLYDESESLKGSKFGARLGVEYKVAKNVTAMGIMNVAEMGTDYYATKGVNPAWFQVGVRYHF